MKLNLCCGDDVPTLRKLLESLGFRVEEIRNDGGTNIMCWAYKRC